MPATEEPAPARRRWFAKGDLNAFSALALNNLSDLVIIGSLLIGVFGFPREIVLYRMIPGTAAGVVLGNLVYSWMAGRLSIREGRSDVCAMPLGINTPSIFVMVFVVMGPLYAETRDAAHAWRVGMAVTVLVGLFKMMVAPFGEAVRAAVPRAGLLGSLGGAGVTLIAFLPFLNLVQDPIVGVVSLVVLLATLLGGLRLPAGVPGAFGALLLGTLLGTLLLCAGYASPLLPAAVSTAATVRLSVPVPTLEFVAALGAALSYLPAALPFALGAVVGGIDNTESAAAAGDEYSANQMLLTQGACTVVAGLCGGVVESTSYIGHSAYKEMGARAGYTIGTALFVGLGALLGVFPFLVDHVPVAAVAPILIYVGLQVCAQAFQATPARHGLAVAMAMIPTIGLVVALQAGSLLEALNVAPQALTGQAALAYRTLLMVGNGAIVSALLWGAVTASLVDRQLGRGAAYCFVGVLLTLFGVIHSPFPRGELFVPWRLTAPEPYHLAAAYAGAGMVLLLLRAPATPRPSLPAHEA